MTEAEKAQEIFSQMLQIAEDNYPQGAHETAKRCAIRAVDQLIAESKMYNNRLWEGCARKVYWQRVKRELEAK